MLDHEKALKQPELYGGMGPYMCKALEMINFHSSCCTNNDACDIHTHSSSNSKRTRLCDKIIPMLIHNIRNDLIVYHRISNHYHNYKSKNILNNNDCFVCDTDKTCIVSERFFKYSAEEMKKQNEATSTSRTFYDYSNAPDTLSTGSQLIGNTNRNKNSRFVQIYLLHEVYTIPSVRVPKKRGEVLYICNTDMNPCKEYMNNMSKLTYSKIGIWGSTFVINKKGKHVK